VRCANVNQLWKDQTQRGGFAIGPQCLTPYLSYSVTVIPHKTLRESRVKFA